MGKKKILVIDNDESVRVLLKVKLENTFRFSVLTLEDGKDVIAKVHTFKPDIILLDLIMPTLGGLEVCDMLNDDPFGKSIPIIILSCLYKDTDRIKAFKVGVVDYIEKPVQINEVIAGIEKALKLNNS